MQNKVIPSHFFTVKEQSLVSMFCQGKKRFVIPYNQRPWSWKEKNIDELWSDLLKTTGFFYESLSKNALWIEKTSPTGSPHFIGAFVFEEKDNDLQVVDGQQRITSISMFVSAIRNLMKRLLSDANDSNFRSNVEYFLDSFKQWLVSDFDGKSIVTRLQVGDHFQEFYSNYVVKCINKVERDSFVNKSEIDLNTDPVLKNFKWSYDYIQKKVDDFFLDFPSDEHRYSAATAIFSILENCFICISADVRKESFSYEVFKCLNAKGMPLSEADKLKNELFTQSELSQHDAIKKSWDVISSNTPYSAVSQFIRQRHVALYGDCPDSQLHSTITKLELEGKIIPSVVIDWEMDSEIFARVTLHKEIQGKSAYDAEELNYLNEIKNLKIGLASILLFAAHKKLFQVNREGFKEILKMCVNFSFRTLTIGKKDTSYLESSLGRAARELMKSGDIKAVKKILRDASPDSDFVSEFERHSARTAQAQFYILDKIENYLLNGTPFRTVPHSDKFNVEHIMPRKFDEKRVEIYDEWSWARADKDLHKQYLNRLGNLSLLEGDINKDVSNFDYECKRNRAYPKGYELKKSGVVRKSYIDSLLPSIKELLSEEFKGWSFERIAYRQKLMAQHALKIWSL